MNDRIIMGWDTETHRISAQALHPRIVCVQTSINGDASVVCRCEADFEATLDLVMDAEENIVRVAHNLSFDLGVLCAHNPEYIPLAFNLIDKGLVTCTAIREKLLNLTTHGNIDYMNVGDSNSRVGYRLADLVKRYFGVDIVKVEIKADGQIVGDADAWRINFDVLEDLPVSEWPQDAIDYAASDAVYAEAVYAKQEEVRQATIVSAGHDPFATESFRVGVDFALGFLTSRGVATDPDRVAQVEAMLAEQLSPEKTARLLQTGILRPEQTPRPFANGAKNHEEGCDRKACECPVRMTAGKASSIDKGAISKHVTDLADARPDDFVLKYTDPTDKFPDGQLSVDADWLQEYAHKDPVLVEYKHRQYLQKLVTTEIPRMKDQEGNVAPVVRADFDVLKETGRTSSRAGKLYPSFNGQNVDPRVRGCYVPRAGFALFSADYSSMELGTLAQTCINLFGHSKLGEIINAGIDPHAYLAAQLALHLDEDFAQALLEEGVDTSDRDAVFAEFDSLRENEDTVRFFDHYRKFSKPTGLGYPGGLGADTFVTYAKGTFGVEVDRETAVLLKDIWKQTFPEMAEYFTYVNQNAKDELNGARRVTVTKIDPETKQKTVQEKWLDRYMYKTPMGLVRMACDYCSCCNGMGLQSPSAEGALLGLYNLVRECYDKTRGSILYGKVFPTLFIHDENFGEVEISTPEEMTALMRRVETLMVDAMRVVTPDVRAAAQTVLMSRWDKYAKPKTDEHGNYLIVDPDESKKKEPEYVEA